MLIFISLILISLSLIIALAIIIKKFPALAILDVENMPKEKEAKFKDLIIKNKIERDMAKLSGYISRFFLVASKSFSRSLEKASDRLKKIKLGHKIEAHSPYYKKEKIIKNLILDSERAIKLEDYSKAEKKLVEVISYDQKNIIAFFKLGEVYQELRKYPESRQTYEYVLKLNKYNKKNNGKIPVVKAQEVYFALASLEEKVGNNDAAYQNILDALEIEPNNPRFLDLILNLSIIKKDKALASEYLKRLALVNPENKKLKEREDLIIKLDNSAE